MASSTSVSSDPKQRRQAVRTAILLGLVAVAFYAAYIYYALKHGHP